MAASTWDLIKTVILFFQRKKKMHFFTSSVSASIIKLNWPIRLLSLSSSSHRVDCFCFFLDSLRIEGFLSLRHTNINPALIYSFILDILEHSLQSSCSLEPSLNILTHLWTTTDAICARNRTCDPAQDVRLSWFSLPSSGRKGHPKPNWDPLSPQLNFLWWPAGPSSSQVSAQHGHSSGILPARQDSFPRCTSLPAAASLLHSAAPWRAAHTAGCWRSRTDDHVSLTRYTRSSHTHARLHTHTRSRAVCVSSNSLWQRVLAVRMLHHSLSSHTAWPSNTALQWWLKEKKQILHTLTVIA